MNPDLVDQGQLERWLAIAGWQIGMCDWRPDCGGEYGCFDVASIEELPE